MNDYRLIISPPATGSWNMAADEAILDSIGMNESLPTIRLFAWDPPCLSLGYAQSINDVDKAALAENGWGLVRRMTGGRAILHADELTYSIIAPHDEPLVTGNLLESYQRIARGLLRTLELMGIKGEINKAPVNVNSYTPGQVCFVVPSAFEITFRGKKLIGSAQARRKHGVLQHGSLPMGGDLGRIIKVLSFTDGSDRNKSLGKLMDHATNLEMITGLRLSWETAATAFIEAFKSELGLKLTPGELSLKESEKIVKLMRSKYSLSSWTERV